MSCLVVAHGKITKCIVLLIPHFRTYLYVSTTQTDTNRNVIFMVTSLETSHCFSSGSEGTNRVIALLYTSHLHKSFWCSYFFRVIHSYIMDKDFLAILTKLRSAYDLWLGQKTSQKYVQVCKKTTLAGTLDEVNISSIHSTHMHVLYAITMS